MKYKPKTIEAFPYDGSRQNAEELRRWAMKQDSSIHFNDVGLEEMEYPTRLEVSIPFWSRKKSEYVSLDVREDHVVIYEDYEFSKMSWDKFHRKYELDEG